MDQFIAARQRFGRVLHATDLSSDGDTAFAHGLKLALAGRGEFFIVHTAVHRAQAGAEWQNFPGVRATLAAWKLLPADAPKTAVSEVLGINVRKIDIPDHEAVHGIRGLVERNAFDLIVLASEARDGLARWMHASVAESLARVAAIPTLFLPKDGHGFIDPADGGVTLRNILIPINRRPPPSGAVDIALDLVTLLGADQAVIHLFHVGDTWPQMPIAGESGPRMKRRSGAGPVVDQIIAAADDVDADLIVMATDGHDGILDILRGSTTEQVLRRAGRALLAVPTA